MEFLLAIVGVLIGIMVMRSLMRALNKVVEDAEKQGSEDAPKELKAGSAGFASLKEGCPPHGWSWVEMDGKEQLYCSKCKMTHRQVLGQ